MPPYTPRFAAVLAPLLAFLAVASFTASAAAGGEGRPKGPAAPGKYEGEVGGRQLTLQVSRDGRFMTGWSGQLRLTCGGFPGLPTYPTVFLDFPRTKIAGNGRLSRTWKGDGFTMEMEARFSGKRARMGSVGYSGAGRCFGSADWSARLKR